jgi:hypothetical protein
MSPVTTPSTSPPVTFAVWICEKADGAKALIRKTAIRTFFISASIGIIDGRNWRSYLNRDFPGYLHINEWVIC